VNPYLVVTDLDDAQRHFPDSKRIEQLLGFIDSSNGPFFAHVHLMETHGSKFSPQRRLFSLGKKQPEHWMTDFYDDSILNYDLIVQRVVTHLKENNMLEKTLVILTSDHGSKWVATERIPLILRFPNQQYAGVLHNNVQRIDVTASIIEYLGLEKPDWIEGESFLNGEFEPDRPIFYADSIAWGPQNGAGWRDVSSYEAPYYSLGGVGVIVAQSWHYWNLSKNRMSSGKIRNHTAPLADKELPAGDVARDQIAGHLQKYMYPVPKSKK
jgi:arylsulfatase A-like enzyme